VFSPFEAIWVHLRYGPVIRSPSFIDGFVNRLQDFQFPSFLLFKLRGFELLPRWDFHPLFMPAFAGRTLTRTDPSAARGFSGCLTIRPEPAAKPFGGSAVGVNRANWMTDPRTRTKVTRLKERQRQLRIGEVARSPSFRSL
jgi:hypothetical protein